MKSLVLFALLISAFAFLYSNTKLYYYNCYYKEKKINVYPMTKLEASSLANRANLKLNIELVCKDELFLDLKEFYKLRD